MADEFSEWTDPEAIQRRYARGQSFAQRNPGQGAASPLAGLVFGITGGLENLGAHNAAQVNKGLEQQSLAGILGAKTQDDLIRAMAGSRVPHHQQQGLGILSQSLDPARKQQYEAGAEALRHAKEKNPLEIDQLRLANDIAKRKQAMDEEILGIGPPASAARSATAAPAAAPSPAAPLPRVPGVTLDYSGAGASAPPPSSAAPAPTSPLSREGILRFLAARTPEEQLAWKGLYLTDRKEAFKQVMEWASPNKEEEKAYQKEMGDQRAKRAAEGLPLSPTVERNIMGGMRELYGIPDRYGGDKGVFGSAVGPFQGDPNSWFLGPVARALGSLKTLGNEKAPAEVRRAIQGATDTVASVIKPLIRKPGEGTWSDADQARLNMIVGELAQANDVAQYRRELDNVRRRINANFHLSLPPLGPEGASGETTGASNAIPRIQNDADYARLNPGQRYIDPTGQVRTKQ